MVMEIDNHHHRLMRSFTAGSRPKRPRSPETLCERPTKRQLLVCTETQSFTSQHRDSQLFPMSGLTPDDWVQQTDGLRLDSPMAVLAAQAVSSVVDEDASMQDDENTALRQTLSSESTSYSPGPMSYPRTAIQPPTLAIPQYPHLNSQLHSASPRSYSPAFSHPGAEGSVSSGAATPSSDMGMRMTLGVPNPAIRFTPATPLDQIQRCNPTQAQPVLAEAQPYQPQTPRPSSASLEAQDSMMVSPVSIRHIPGGDANGVASPTLEGVGFGAVESPVSTRRKPRITMGPRADCEQCRMKVKGHYMHFS